jgi:hypothetical protein
MAINFVQGQVSQGDPNPGGPSATSNIKDKTTKVIKLTSANFTTTNVDILGAVLPADATILNVDYYVKTILAGGGITAATISIGSSTGGSQYVTTFNVFSASGTSGPVTPVTGIMQNYALPLPGDLQLFVRGTATTGNPTSGEIYIIVTYVR